MGDITKGVGGRFKATTEFQASGYGKGNHKVKVKDTLTGECREDYFWPEESRMPGASKEEVAKRLASNMLADQKAALEDDGQGWRFDVGSEPEITEGEGHGEVVNG